MGAGTRAEMFLLVLSPCFRLACTHRDALMIPSGKHSSETGLGFQPKGKGHGEIAVGQRSPGGL